MKVGTQLPLTSWIFTKKNSVRFVILNPKTCFLHFFCISSVFFIILNFFCNHVVGGARVMVATASGGAERPSWEGVDTRSSQGVPLVSLCLYQIDNY